MGANQEQAKEDMDVWVDDLFAGLGDSYDNLLKPRHTGEDNVHKVHIEVDSVGHHYIAGDVYWEDGDVSRDVRYPIKTHKAEALLKMAARDQPRVLTNLLNQHIENMLMSLPTFSKSRRSTVWVGEQADFVKMYPKLPRKRECDQIDGPHIIGKSGAQSVVAVYIAAPRGCIPPTV